MFDGDDGATENLREEGSAARIRLPCRGCVCQRSFGKVSISVSNEEDILILKCHCKEAVDYNFSYEIFQQELNE